MATIGCANEASPSSASVAPTIEVTCPEGSSVEGRACSPRFDVCDERSVARLGGGCIAVGIADDACGDGFIATGDGACRPVLPKSTCAAEQLAIPGDASCRPIASCGSQPFAEVTGPAVYVDAAATGGDGSRARPFATIGAALAVADTTVLVAPGTYEENLRIERATKIVGRCATDVVLRGTIEALAPITLVGISITGSGHAVAATSTDVELDSVAIHDVAGNGVRALGDGAIRIRNTHIDRAVDAAVFARGARVTLERSVLSRTGGAGHGVDIVGLEAPYGAASLTVDRSVIEAMPHEGVLATSATTTLTDSVVRAVGGPGVVAMYLRPPLSFTSRRMVIERATTYGMYLGGCASTIEASTIRRTYGVGLRTATWGELPGVTAIRNSTFEDNASETLRLEDSVVRLERSIVRRTEAISDRGRGIALMRGGLPDVISQPALDVVESLVADSGSTGITSIRGTLRVTGSRIRRSSGFGATVFASSAWFDRSLIEETAPDSAGAFGVGINVNWDGVRPTELTVTDSAIETSSYAGIGAFGGVVTVLRSRINDIVPQPSDGDGGVCISVAPTWPRTLRPGALFVGRSVLSRCAKAGVLSLGSTTAIEDSVIRDIRALRDGRFGDGVVAAADVMRSRFARSELSLRHSLLSHNARAGLAVFGSTASVGDAQFECDPIAIDVEPLSAEAARLSDLGGNVCGCADATIACSAQSQSLAPLPPPKVGEIPK